MASLSPLTASNITTTTTSPLPCPSFHMGRQITITKRVARKVSCSGRNNDEKTPEEAPKGRMDRRNVLLGLGGLYGVACLSATDPTKLRYQYQDVDIPWLQTRPTPLTEATQKGKKLLTRSRGGFLGEFPIDLNKVVQLTVPRPKTSRSKKEKDEEEEVLLIKGIELDGELPVKFDVYINDEDDKGSRPDKSEFAGSFVNVPRKHGKYGKKKLMTNLKLGITDLLEDLGAEDDDDVVVTLVPRLGKGEVSIGGISIVLAS